MNENVARLIVAVAQTEGAELRLYGNYSGRGMFGRQTAGVVGSQRDVMKYALKAMKLLVRLECGEEDDLPSLDVCDGDVGDYDEAPVDMEYPSVKEFENEMETLSHDSMGCDAIVY